VSDQNGRTSTFRVEAICVTHKTVKSILWLWLSGQISWKQSVPSSLGSRHNLEALSDQLTHGLGPTDARCVGWNSGLGAWCSEHRAQAQGSGFRAQGVGGCFLGAGVGFEGCGGLSSGVPHGRTQRQTGLTEEWVSGFGWGFEGSGCRVQGAGCRVQG